MFERTTGEKKKKKTFRNHSFAQIMFSAAMKESGSKPKRSVCILLILQSNTGRGEEGRGSALLI